MTSSTVNPPKREISMSHYWGQLHLKPTKKDEVIVHVLHLMKDYCETSERLVRDAQFFHFGPGGRDDKRTMSRDHYDKQQEFREKKISIYIAALAKHDKSKLPVTYFTAEEIEKYVKPYFFNSHQYDDEEVMGMQSLQSSKGFDSNFWKEQEALMSTILGKSSTTESAQSSKGLDSNFWKEHEALMSELLGKKPTTESTQTAPAKK